MAKTRRRGLRRGKAPQPVVLAGEHAERELKRIALAQDRLARQGGPHPWRWRWQLVPFAWLAVMTGGLAARHWQADAVAVAVAAGVPCGVAALVARGATDRFTRVHVQTAAGWAWLWAIIFAGFGAGPWAAVALIGWAIPAGYWAQHYSWRPAAPAAEPDLTVAEVFAELCDARKWHAGLGVSKPIPNGQQWEVQCRGTKTNIDQIAAQPEAVAAAFDASVAEAYVEATPDGVKSTGLFTKLRTGTLTEPREWDGATVDPATGLAVVGRFPDGQPVRSRLYVPGVGGGARHELVVGCDGSGKTGLLNLGLCISAMSGRVAQAILDPQHGQALPAWLEHAQYARGPEECVAYLDGLYAGMQAQSAWLADLEWTHPLTGQTRRGMDFFDTDLCGLPLTEITIDEAAVLLAIKGIPARILDLAKLGRKVGFRVRLGLQVPSWAEMGKSELRSILTGGNVFIFRTGDKVSQGMVNIPADPYKLAKYFRDGSPTTGLGYCDTIDQRQSVPMRTDWVPDPHAVAEQAAKAGLIRELPPLVAGALAKALGRPATAARMAERAEVEAEAVLAHLGSGPLLLGDLLARAGCKVSDVVRLERAGRWRCDGDQVVPR